MYTIDCFAALKTIAAAVLPTENPDGKNPSG